MTDVPVQLAEAGLQLPPLHPRLVGSEVAVKFKETNTIDHNPIESSRRFGMVVVSIGSRYFSNISQTDDRSIFLLSLDTYISFRKSWSRIEWSLSWEGGKRRSARPGVRTYGKTLRGKYHHGQHKAQNNYLHLLSGRLKI